MEFQLNATLEILGRTPSTLRALLAGLSDVWTRADEGRETWSAYDTVGHLVHGEEADWMSRLRVILEHGESRPFTPFDRFAQFEKSAGASLEELLDRFEALRTANLREVESLDLQPSQFALTGTHPELGRVTVVQLLATWAAHDLGHIAQIARVMAKQYSGAVGPWKAYMPVFEDR